MYMGKKWLQRILAAGLALTLVIGQTVTGFADGGEGNIVIAGGNVFDVETGKDTKIKLQVKNKGAGTAENVYLQARGADGIVPYKLSLDGGGNVGDLGRSSVKSINLNVKMDGIVEEPSYPIALDYIYNTESGESKNGTTTIYLRVKGYNREPEFQLDSMKLTPDALSPGSSAHLSGELVNQGEFDIYQVELSLDNLTTDGISLAGGFNSKSLSTLPVGGKMGFTFPLVASADMAAGNYPVAIKLTYQNAYGKEYEKTQQYYINVGGIAGQKADLEIRNMSEPQGTYGVNQNFTVSFDLHNKGAVAAKNIVITANPVDASAVVPKSSSVKTVSELAPGASSHQSFTFAGTAASESQNYAIEFAVEYTSGGTATTTFRQFAGVNVHNADSEENSSKPKIIVSNYVSDPLIVMAGEEFDLNLTLLNTHKEKTVSNIKMFLTLAEETSSSSEKSGNIFTPVNSSNTFYFDSIPPKGTVEKALRLYVVPEAQPKTYTLTVNFEYEDGKGQEYTATELLGINVKQVTELQIDDFSVPEMVEQYQPVTVAFSYYNTGKVALSNLMIKVEGDVDCQNKSNYIGNMDSGESDYFETTFSPINIGEVPVSIVITYEDPSGETIEQRRDLLLNVMEPYIPEDMEGMEENPPMDMRKTAAGVGMLIVLTALLVLFVKKQKEPPKSTGESVSDAEELEDEIDDFIDEYEDKDEEGMPL